MAKNIIIPKDGDLGSLVVSVKIDGHYIKNMLIDIGEIINVMT